VRDAGAITSVVSCLRAWSDRAVRDEDFGITIVGEAAGSDVAALRDALHAYNEEATGYRDGRALSCFLRDGAGELVAGIDGFTWGGYAKVEYLWVEQARRGHGLGRRLLRAAEDEARRRGCTTIVVDTHEFQAPWLYPRLGYELVGTTHDTPRGYRQFLYEKRLTAR
jgi:GNAT superfamily N-acetyltransferase